MLTPKNSLLKIFCLFLCFLFTPIANADRFCVKVVLLGKIGSGKTTLHSLLKCADEATFIDSDKLKPDECMYPKHTINISVQTKTVVDTSLNWDNKHEYLNHHKQRFAPYQWRNGCIRLGNNGMELDCFIYDTTAESKHESLVDEFCNNAHAIFLCVKAEDFTDRKNGKLYFKESEDFYKLLRKIPKIAPKSKVIIFLTQIENIEGASNELKNQIKNFVGNIKKQNEFKDYVHSSFNFDLDYSDKEALDAFQSSVNFSEEGTGSSINKYVEMFIMGCACEPLSYYSSDDPRLVGLLNSLRKKNPNYFPKTPKGFSSFIIKEEKKYVETYTNNDCTGSKSTRTRTKNEYKLKVLKNADEE